MLDLEPQFPRISRAVRLISADKGDHDVATGGALTALIERRIRRGADGLARPDLEQVEQYLAGMVVEDLETLCAAETMAAGLLFLDSPSIVQQFLEQAFAGAADA